MTEEVWQAPPNRGGSTYDWPSLRASLAKRKGEWMLLGKGERLSIATAIRNESISTMTGVQVRTRNNYQDDEGVRRCDIYLSIPK